MKNIKPGYLVKICSWENDGDNYNTTEFSGLTESAARVLISIAKLFYSKNGGSFVDGKWKFRENAFGNADVYEKRHDLADAITKIIGDARNNGYDIPKEWDVTHPDYVDCDIEADDLSDFYHDAIYDMIGIWNEGEYYRVFESFEVYFVPENSVKNVTDNF